jgi:flavin-dependent dehydrogenase
MSAAYDIVVVGAGPAGSAFAAGMAARGHSVVLVEKRRLPAHKVCGEFLSPEAQASLTNLGLYDRVASLAPSPMTAARLVSRRGITLDVPLPGTAWGLSRYAFDAALADAAAHAGAEVLYGVTASAIDCADDRALRLVDGGADGRADDPADRSARTAPRRLVRLREGGDERIIETRAVVLACGRHPPIALRPSARSGATSAIGAKRHYRGLTMPARVELYLFRDGYAGLAPVEDGRVNLCLLASKSALDRAGRSTAALLDAAAQWNPALGQRLAGAEVVLGTEVAVAPVDAYAPATPWDGVARLGDAAVMIPPLVGDGMAMALRSAELCVPLADDCLTGRISEDTWAARYRSAWHAEFAGPVRTSRALSRVLAQPHAADALLVVGAVVPALSSQLVRATRGKGDHSGTERSQP